MTRRGGLWTLYDRHPLTTTTLLALATLLTGAGLDRVWFSDDYREIFRTSSPAFELLEEIGEQFGSAEQEVVVLVEGDFTRLADVEALEALTAGLTAAEGVTGVESPTSESRLLRHLAGAQDAAQRERVLGALREHPLLSGLLISRDLDAALLAVTIDRGLKDLTAMEPALEAIEKPLAEAAEAGLKVHSTGLPLFRSEIIRSVQRDQVVFTSVGLLLGTVVLWLVFWDPRPMVLVGVGPLIGAVWTVGTLGWLGEPINVVNNVVPVLVLVIGMTDSVHLVREFQRAQREGADQGSAAREAIRRVGPACALTTLTTVAAFSSLALADFGIVQRFGLACAGGLVLTFLAVVTAVPLLAGHSPLGRPRRAASSSPSRGWRLAGILAVSGRRPRWLTVLAFGLVGLSGLAAARLTADYRYDEFLPESSRVVEGLRAVEAHFGGAFPLRVVVDWPEGAPAAGVLQVLESVEKTLVASPIAHSPTSLLLPLRTLVGSATPVADLPEPELIPAETRERFWRDDLRRALISARMPGLGARTLQPELNSLNAALASLERDHAGFSFSLNGLLPVSARTSLRMIDALAMSLAIACVVIFVAISLALRSLRLGLVTLPVNLLPLGAICLFLVAASRPLQFTNVTLLTVVLGIAVDDSIHFVMAFRRKRTAGATAGQAIANALDTVGVSLVITTCLLFAGFGAVWLSEAPQMSFFGGLACLALLAALLADLLLLPALLLEFSPAGSDDLG